MWGWWGAHGMYVCLISLSTVAGTRKEGDKAEGSKLWTSGPQR